MGGRVTETFLLHTHTNIAQQQHAAKVRLIYARVCVGGVRWVHVCVCGENAALCGGVCGST